MIIRKNTVKVRLVIQAVWRRHSNNKTCEAYLEKIVYNLSKYIAGEK
jgi:two-component SAPR family response regulator